MMGMGNFSEVESGRRSTSAGGDRVMTERVGTGVRGSVVGFVTGRPAGMERLSDIEEGGSGREGLRKSLNGLGQNKW